jgi:hypothetical protein
MPRSRFLRLLGGLGAASLMALTAVPPALGDSGASRFRTSCEYGSALCTEIGDTHLAYGNQYVGHDEPSLLFYSHTPGSGNQMTYQLTLPKEPDGPFSQRKSYNFELHPSFWFGMAVCDTQSYPEQVKTCPPHSDANAVDVRKNNNHPGTAFVELQFYPPGWADGIFGSCATHQWCAAMTIDSLSENPIDGTVLNNDCQAKIFGGPEYINYAWLTRSGKPQATPNPLNFDVTQTPGPDVSLMNPGDQLTVTLHDSPDGLVTTIVDHTTGGSGSMTASASNGFGQIRFAPAHGCAEIPYTFHPEYSTSTLQTTVPWAAHSYNIAFSDEIGHFDFCTKISSVTGSCEGLEGRPGDQEPADFDDNFCVPASASLLYPTGGCTDSNQGFDGVSYLRAAWPGDSPNTPTPILFSSPRTIGGAKYARLGFETDLPRIEAKDLGLGQCERFSPSGAGCVNPPTTDDGQAAFYPYFSATSSSPGGSCTWGIGAQLPNTINNFGGNSTTEFGPLLARYYYDVGGGASPRFNDFRRVTPNPC